jgi:DNA polymerase I
VTVVPARRKPGADKRSSSRFLARVLPGARPGSIRGFVEPSLPTPRDKPPSGPRWLHEIEFNGYRIQAHLKDGHAELFTRNGDDWTQRFARIVTAVRRLPVNEIILDGEVIVQNAVGASDLGALEDDLAKGRRDRFVYYAFDLLHLDGFDISASPLIDRKRVLASLLGESGSSVIALSEHLETDGDELFERARAMGLEGIVSKARDAPYRSGRSKNWFKIKTVKRDPKSLNAPLPAKSQGTRRSSKRPKSTRPLLVVDGDSFAHRAYHALPKSIRRNGNKGGGAIVGFANYLMRFYETERPRAVVVGWDTLEAPTWRNKAFASYQSGREFDDALVDQLDVLPQFVTACGFANAKAAGYEADDFLAAAVREEENRGGTVIVASGDRDAFQLASASTTILHPVGGGQMARIGPSEVRERYGVDPKQVTDFIALRGDPSDKIPGAKGVGPKGAASLLNRYLSLEAALADGRFASQADKLRLYRRIATMDASAPMPALDDQTPDWESASKLARRWELNALAERLHKLAQVPLEAGRQPSGI